ncbi:MAG: transcriptional regulator, IclR family [Bryobacterales bacterium]|nr:transcriptional regulator, IclR family [Bryobacterales bacterium]
MPLQRAKVAPGRKPVVPNRTAARDKNFIALTDKVFGVLEAFSQNPKEPITLEEITQSVGLAKTTVHRLLYSMKKIGYVDQNDQSGRYMLAPKFFELGRSVLPYQRVAALARPLLENLRIRCGESVHVGVLDKGLVTYIAVLESQNPYRCAAVIGEVNYAHSTAVGKCLLADLSEAQVEEIILEHGLSKLARNTITNGTQLLEELRRVRDEGVATNIEENIDGVICIAAPIRDQAGQTVAALSVSGPAIRMQVILEGAKQEVRRVGARISALLGCPNGDDSSRPISAMPGNPASIQTRQ